MNARTLRAVARWLIVAAGFAAIAFSAARSSAAGGYCEGFQDGYAAGYCYEQGIACNPPPPPLCPLPRVGADSYQDGYNDGFVTGERDAN